MTVYVNRTGENVSSPNTKEQLCEVIEFLHAVLAVAREQRDALFNQTDMLAIGVPCGDGRCYCGGCVL